MHVEASRLAIEEKRDLPESETGSEVKQSQEGKTLSSLLTTNATLVVWLLFLGFGGALMSLYYRRLHFFPDLEWHQALTFLVAFSILGGGFVVIYSLLLYIPGLMWSEFLIFDTEFQNILCYKGPDGWEPCYWNIGKLVAIPFAFFIFYAHLVLMGAAIASFGRAYAAVAAVLGLPVLLRYAWKRFGKELKRMTRKSAKVHYLYEPHDVPSKSLLSKYVLALGLSSVMSLVSVLLIHALIVPGKPDPRAWLLMTICTSVVVTSNLLVAVQFRNKPSRATLTGIVAAVALLIAGEALSEGLSTQIMKRFGFGSRAVTLVVNDKGRALLESYDLKPLKSDAAYGRFPNVLILSRLGSAYLITAGEQRITLPKDMVVSWSRPLEKDEAMAPGIQPALSANPEAPFP